MIYIYLLCYDYYLNIISCDDISVKIKKNRERITFYSRQTNKRGRKRVKRNQINNYYYDYTTITS